MYAYIRYFRRDSFSKKSKIANGNNKTIHYFLHDFLLNLRYKAEIRIIVYKLNLIKSSYKNNILSYSTIINNNY